MIKSTFNLESFEKLGAKGNTLYTTLEKVYIPSIPFNEILYTFYEGKLTAFKVLYWEKFNCTDMLNYLIEFPNQKRVWLKGFINGTHPIYKTKEDYIEETITNNKRRLKVNFEPINTNKYTIASSYYISQGEICVKYSNFKYVVGNDKDIFIGLEHVSYGNGTKYFNNREECMHSLLNGLEMVDFAPKQQPTLFDFDDEFVSKQQTIKIEVTIKQQTIKL